MVPKKVIALVSTTAKTFLLAGTVNPKPDRIGRRVMSYIVVIFPVLMAFCSLMLIVTPSGVTIGAGMSMLIFFIFVFECLLEYYAGPRESYELFSQ